MKTILSAVAMLALMTGGAMAQSTATTPPPGVNCNRTAPTTQGSSNGSSGSVHQNFVSGSCETLVLPNGHTEVQNGPAATDNGGSASPHEGGHGSSGGSAGGGAAGGAGGGGAGQ